MNSRTLPILARRAWAKVCLDAVRNKPAREAGAFESALKEFRAADRAQRKLNGEYRDHHEALWTEEQQANTTPELPL